MAGHPLERSWSFWFDTGPPKGISRDDYESYIQNLGTFDTIQDFWRYWNNIVEATALPSYSNLRMFKTGVKPMWEDPANADGGKWMLICPHNQVSKMWTEVVLHTIGEQFENSSDIVGVTLSRRPKCDTVSVWNATSTDDVIIQSLKSDLHKMFNESKKSITIEYQTHKGSIQNNQLSSGDKTPERKRSSLPGTPKRRRSDLSATDEYTPSSGEEDSWGSTPSTPSIVVTVTQPKSKGGKSKGSNNSDRRKSGRSNSNPNVPSSLELPAAQTAARSDSESDLPQSLQHLVQKSREVGAQTLGIGPLPSNALVAECGFQLEPPPHQPRSPSPLRHEGGAREHSGSSSGRVQGDARQSSQQTGGRNQRNKNNRRGSHSDSGVDSGDQKRNGGGRRPPSDSGSNSNKRNQSNNNDNNNKQQGRKQRRGSNHSDRSNYRPNSPSMSEGSRTTSGANSGASTRPNSQSNSRPNSRSGSFDQGAKGNLSNEVRKRMPPGMLRPMEGDDSPDSPVSTPKHVRVRKQVTSSAKNEISRALLAAFFVTGLFFLIYVFFE